MERTCRTHYRSENIILSFFFLSCPHYCVAFEVLEDFVVLATFYKVNLLVVAYDFL